MNHQPFREWIFSEEKLSAEEAQALQEHMNTCESCAELNASWSEVESVMRQSSLVCPREGFTARWNAHLAEYQQAKQKTRVWTTMGVSIAIIFSLLVVMVTQLWSFIQSPDQYVAIWLNSLISLVSVYYALVDHLQFGSTYLPIYTVVGIFFLVGVISFMSVLWLAAYRKFSMVRRTI